MFLDGLILYGLGALMLSAPKVKPWFAGCFVLGGVCLVVWGAFRYVLRLVLRYGTIDLFEALVS